MKFRILTEDNEWLYGKLNVLESRVGVLLVDSKGKHVSDPRIRLRADTLSKFACHFCQTDYYEGDIVETGEEREALVLDVGSSSQEVEEDERTRPFPFCWDEGAHRIGNIYENPELVD